MRLQQLPVQLHLPFQSTELGVSALDQCDKLANHARAFASKGCESLVLICEISAGSGVTCNLGVAGRSAPDVVLQACNADSISSAASLQSGQLLRVVMGIVLLCGSVIHHSFSFLFCSCLRFLCLRLSLF